jgi:hypothetical protein
MSHKLKFADNEAERDAFKVLWDGFENMSQPRGKEEVRRAADIERKLISLSIEVPDDTKIKCPRCQLESSLPPNLQVSNQRELKPGGGYIILSDDAFKYLNGVVDSIQPRQRFVKTLVDLIDKMEASAKVKKDEKDLILEELEPAKVIEEGEKPAGAEALKH